MEKYSRTVGEEHAEPEAFPPPGLNNAFTNRAWVAAATGSDQPPGLRPRGHEAVGEVSCECSTVLGRKANTRSGLGIALVLGRPQPTNRARSR